MTSLRIHLVEVRSFAVRVDLVRVCVRASIRACERACIQMHTNAPACGDGNDMEVGERLSMTPRARQSTRAPACPLAVGRRWHQVVLAHSTVWTRCSREGSLKQKGPPR